MKRDNSSMLCMKNIFVHEPNTGERCFLPFLIGFLRIFPEYSTKGFFFSLSVLLPHLFSVSSDFNSNETAELLSHPENSHSNVCGVPHTQRKTSMKEHS